MNIEFVSKANRFALTLKKDLDVSLMSMILNDIFGIKKESVDDIDSSLLEQWVQNLNNGIMVISPKNLNFGMRII